MKSFEDKPVFFGPDVHKMTKLDIVKMLKKICPTIFLVCFRSKNANCVVYEAMLDEEGKVIRDAPVEGYWIMFEPDHMKARRARNIIHDREEFAFLDTHVAWGFQATKSTDTLIKFHFNRLPTAKCAVKIKPQKTCQLITVQNNRILVGNYMYVEGSENPHLLNLSQNIRQLYINVVDVTEKDPKLYVAKNVFLIDHRAEQPVITFN